MAVAPRGESLYEKMFDLHWNEFFKAVPSSTNRNMFPSHTM